MPMYNYRCRSCGVAFNKTQLFADKALTRCPECRARNVSRVPQLPAVVFKGSGWYSTDQRPGARQSGRPTQPNAQTEVSAGAKSDR
jgi:putative FmdB family regulatory protein